MLPGLNRRFADCRGRLCFLMWRRALVSLVSGESLSYSLAQGYDDGGAHRDGLGLDIIIWLSRTCLII